MDKTEITVVADSAARIGRRAGKTITVLTRTVAAMIGPGLAEAERDMGRILSPDEQIIFLRGYTYRCQQEHEELKAKSTSLIAQKVLEKPLDTINPSLLADRRRIRRNSEDEPMEYKKDPSLNDPDVEQILKEYP